jgi:hypothetical protein
MKVAAGPQMTAQRAVQQHLVFSQTFIELPVGVGCVVK